MTVVFTAALGETDTVRAPLAVDPAVRYLCFSERPAVAPYEWIRTDPTDHPQMAARRIKILADHPVLQAADLTLWHDASYMLTRTLRWLGKGLADWDLLALRHPRRARIEDEAVAIARYGYLAPDAAQAHVARYRSAGFTENVVTTSGLMGRRVSPLVSAFNTVWWSEVEQWNGRDQGSIDFSAWRAGLRVRHMDGTVRHNKYAVWRPWSMSAGVA